MHRSAYLLLALTALFWGGNSVAGRMAVGEISPMLLVAGRWGLAFLLMLVIGWRETMADAATLRARGLWLATMAFVGFTFFNICLYAALHFTTAVNSSVLQASMPVFVFAAVIALTAWMLHGTVGGRHLYAVGSNPDAARLAGVRVQVIRFIPFVVTGLYCGIASILLVGLLNSAVPDGAATWPLSVVAAVVVGGVSIAGGTGTVTMGVLGVLLIGVINNGLNLLNMPSSWQSIMTGLVLVIAVAGDAAFREQARKRALKRKVDQLNATAPAPPVPASP